MKSGKLRTLVAAGLVLTMLGTTSAIPIHAAGDTLGTYNKTVTDNDTNTDSTTGIHTYTDCTTTVQYTPSRTYVSQYSGPSCTETSSGSGPYGTWTAQPARYWIGCSPSSGTYVSCGENVLWQIWNYNTETLIYAYCVYNRANVDYNGNVTYNNTVKWNVGGGSGC